MLNVNSSIQNEIEYLIQEEQNIDFKFKKMLQHFVDEKGDTEFHFGNLCIQHYEEFSKEFHTDIFKIAAAIELLILSFDIVDDIQDGDAQYSWVHTPALSINSAIAMLVMTTKIIRESSFEHANLAIHILVTYALQSINGQQSDLMNDCNTETLYLQMIEKKSGSLTAMSCLIGTVLALGKAPSHVAEYGRYIGAIHQIKNDIQDLKEWGSKNDILNRKYSLPVIFLLSKNDNISKMIHDYYQDAEATLLDSKLIEAALLDSGAIRYAIAIKNVYKAKALHLIQEMDFSERIYSKLQKNVK